jgi:2-dehydropantoate 2-reductase
MNVRILVVGPGSLGSVFAALLQRAGNQVTLLGRHAGVERLRRKGVHVIGLEEVHVQVPVTADPREMEPVDLLLLCTKAIDTEHTLEPLRGVETRTVVSLQNGVMKERLLAEAFGPEKVLGAATMLGAERLTDGTVDFTARGTTYLGEPDGTFSDRLGSIVATLDNAGLPAQALDDIGSAIWSKACLAAGAFAVSVFTRLPVAGIFARPELAGAVADLLSEAAAVAAAAGHPVRDFPGMRVASWAHDPRHVALEDMARRAAEMTVAPRVVRVSMLQDLLAGRPLEVDEVHGGLLDEARRHGLETPRLALAYSLLKGIDDHPSRSALPDEGWA